MRQHLIGYPGDIAPEAAALGFFQQCIQFHRDFVRFADGAIRGGGGEDEFGGDEELPDEGFRRESADTVKEKDEISSGKPTSDGTKPGVDPSDLGSPTHSKTTDPAADSLGGKSSGTGDAKVTDDAATTGKPTTDGKTVGKAGGKHPSGKPGKLKANAKI